MRASGGGAAPSEEDLMSADFDLMSARDLRRLVATRQASPVEITMRALDKAQATQSSLNAFVFLRPEAALEAAQAAEDAVMHGGPLGLLHGVPISVKDLISLAAEPYCFGSRAMADHVATADAPAVARIRAAGAIVIGKTTTSEFGCKPVGDSPLTGVTRHPWNPAKTPGGSSAGAAASVAAGVTSLALGTDGGGSLRIPASLTGLFGLKAQFGRVPVWPLSATPTLAHVGALARNVGDAALLVAATIPDEGGLQWTESMSIVSSSTKKDLAKAFIQYASSPEGQIRSARLPSYWASIPNKKG